MDESTQYVSKQYVCTISYATPTPPVSVATYSFTPPLARLNPKDTISFRFQPSPGQAQPTQARLIAANKTPTTNMNSSPFLNDANGIDILSNPVLIIGSSSGKWGLAALFSVETATNSHFFFLPDPEIVVGPE